MRRHTVTALPWLSTPIGVGVFVIEPLAGGTVVMSTTLPKLPPRGRVVAWTRSSPVVITQVAIARPLGSKRTEGSPVNEPGPEMSWIVLSKLPPEGRTDICTAPADQTPIAVS